MKRGLVFACAAVLGSMVLGAAVADAGTGAARSFSFAPVAGFADALAATVNQSNGDVYVSDLGSNSLWEFNVSLAGKSAEPDLTFGGEGFVREPHLPGQLPTSELDLPFQSAADGEHNVLVPTVNGGKVYELSVTGEEVELARPLTGIAEPTGVGVDGDGNIYVAQLGGAVRRFNSAGEPVNATGVETSENTLTTASTGVRAMAVDSTGEEIYLATEDGVIQYHLSGGRYVQGQTFGEGFTTGVAVAPAGGPAAGDVFVEANGVIADYEPSGRQLTSFGGEEGHALGGGAGRLAVYSTSTETAIFAPNRSSVEVYVTFPAPTVTAQAADELQRTTAKVNGTVNPEGMTITGCFFEYGAGQTHTCNLSGAEIGSGNAPVAVSAELEGLEPGTNYPFHLVVESEGHVISSTGSKLSTPPVATATTETASNVTTEAATLNATANLFAGAASYHFQYVQEGSGEPHTTEEKPLAVGGQTVIANLTGLAPNERIFFRLVIVPEAPLRPIEGAFASLATKVGLPVADTGHEFTTPGFTPLIIPPAVNHPIPKGAVKVKHARRSTPRKSSAAGRSSRRSNAHSAYPAKRSEVTGCSTVRRWPLARSNTC